ncbi:hypothetical protein C8Q79DRAFT_725229 [Trametes meyenii]|nr:hypothetical protein C8Q79DRAFT_725229 [Trametes meyenii]
MSAYLPSVTRRSTASGSDASTALVTPYDDLPLDGHRKTGPSAPTRDGVHVRCPSEESSVGQPNLRIRRGHVEGGRELADDHESYFALPSRRQATHSPGLNRRGTTRELVGRFESMGGSSAPPQTRRTPDASASTNTSVNTEKAKEKGRSPIRQSFRNLLSVFKKNKPAQKERSPSPTPASLLVVAGTRYRPGGGSPSTTQGGPPTPSKPSLTLQVPPSDLPRTDPRNCTSPVSAHTGKQGPLLYLSRAPGDSDVPAVWMACLAQLHTTHILVSWPSAGGHPTSRLVPFAACADVRSLALGDLDEAERALLPGAPGDVRVFELLFEGRAREKFAAESVAERAGWVSAIWDAVLLAQENRVRSPAVSESVYTSLPVGSVPSMARPQVAELPKADTPRTSRSRISQTSASIVDRALPAIPNQTPEKPTLSRLNIRDLPPVQARQSSLPSGLSPLPAPPATPTSARGSSFLSPGSPSRSQSPSIRNLDQRSVVKQRLAQIQQSEAARPASPVSPSTRRWELKDSPRMRRQDSGTASITNSYVRTEIGSPRSACSGGLTTRPPSLVGSPPPRNSVFRQTGQDTNSGLLGPPPRNDMLFSPASRYSDDGRADGGEPQGVASQMRSVLESLVEVDPPPQSATQFQSECTPDRAVGGATIPALGDICASVDALRSRAATDSTNIVSIRTKVDEVLTEVRRLQTPEDADGSSAVTSKLQQVEAGVKEDMARLQGLLEGLRSANTDAVEGGGTVVTPDVAELHAKLDSLLRLCQARGSGEEGDGSSPDAQTSTNELVEVIGLLKEAEEQRVTQMEQQTDSIRYLNELNNWLEAFVNHGTSQIEGVAAGVQQLCKELGPVPELQDTPEEGEGPPAGSLLSDIRRFLVQHKEREESTTVLHNSVNGLMAAVQEDLRRNAEARNLLTTESVTGMIDRQRADQERMLKALATELSNDIRGERLRFVEAMKEATAINVQIHVEEFKKELTREVMLMTQEVTRLQRERQGLEQQIADLFAFYAKQKQAGKVVDGGRIPSLQAPSTTHSTLSVMPGDIIPPGGIAFQTAQSAYRRPLPSPAPSPTRSR